MARSSAVCLRSATQFRPEKLENAPSKLGVDWSSRRRSVGSRLNCTGRLGASVCRRLRGDLNHLLGGVAGGNGDAISCKKEGIFAGAAVEFEDVVAAPEGLSQLHSTRRRVERVRSWNS